MKKTNVPNPTPKTNPSAPASAASALVVSGDGGVAATDPEVAEAMRELRKRLDELIAANIRSQIAPALSSTPGLLLLTDGTRARVDQVISYRPREGGEIWFMLEGNNPGIMACKTAAAQKEKLKALDEFFGVAEI